MDKHAYSLMGTVLHQLFLTVVCLHGARSCYLFTENKKVILLKAILAALPIPLKVVRAHFNFTDPLLITSLPLPLKSSIKGSNNNVLIARQNRFYGSIMAHLTNSPL